MKQLLFALLLGLFGQCSMQAQVPTFSVTVHTAQSSGYYFLTPIKFAAGTNTLLPTHLILDADGNVAYYKKVQGTTEFKLQPNGLMTYNRQGKYYIMDSTFTLKDSVTTKNGVLFDGHELQILPNGNYLMLGYENVTMDLSAYHIFNGTSAGSTTATVKCNVIQEQDAAKNVVFEWHCKDHYNFGDVDPQWLGSPANVDWTHANALELDADGNFMISLRHFNEITKIRRSDSSIIWRLGGNANQFTFTNDAPMFQGQHDIRRLANGNISLFDNGSAGTTLHPARAKEYQLNETTHTATLVWSYTENASAYSSAMGSVQRLANGNTLVDYGNLVNQNRIFNVVEPGGTKVFEIAFSDTLRSYRAFNYPALPWDLKRPVISCNFNGTQAYLDAGAGHASYLWNTGATTQTIALSTAGNYSVRVPKGQGGFLYSAPYAVSNLSTPCLATGIVATATEESLTIGPNPVSQQLHVSLPASGTGMSLDVFDAVGRCIYRLSELPSEQLTIDASQWGPGLYFLRIGNRTQKLIKQ